MSYGTTPAGFVRKPLIVLLSEIEEKAKVVFGEGVIQTEQSPLGQLNGMVASLSSTLWEIAEDTYQSSDPDQAEGVRLRQLARIRLLEKIAGETDPEFRQAITNAGRARIDLADIERAAVAADGVTYVQPFENKGSAPNADGMPGHSIAVTVIGGDDTAVASAIRPYIVPGVDSYGNTRADIVVDGYCRTVHFIRPVPVRLALQLSVSARPDRQGCPPPSAGAIALAIGNAFVGRDRPTNGRDVDLHLLQTILAPLYPNIEIMTVTVSLGVDGDVMALPYTIDFFEIAQVEAANVTVAFV